MSKLTPAIETTVTEVGYLLRSGQEDVGMFDYTVFVGTLDEMENYRVWFARANRCAKPEVLAYDTFIVRPEERHRETDKKERRAGA